MGGTHRAFGDRRGGGGERRAAPRRGAGLKTFDSVLLSWPKRPDSRRSVHGLFKQIVQGFRAIAYNLLKTRTNVSRATHRQTGGCRGIPCERRISLLFS